MKKKLKIAPDIPVVYIPDGADKGDCPYCFFGVLYRDAELQEQHTVAELYTCDLCREHFIENYKYGRRNFTSINFVRL